MRAVLNLFRTKSSAGKIKEKKWKNQSTITQLY